jgi:GSH-dependent disulfide-bond oxidoreductase
MPASQVACVDTENVDGLGARAIMLYLAEKTSRFLPAPSPKSRGEVLSRLMFVASGIGPQAVLFRSVAPEPNAHAVNRHTFEAQRHWGILNTRPGRHRFMAGEGYSIVDMTVRGWSRLVPNVLERDATRGLLTVQRLLDEITERPEAARALPAR